jgi:N-methylhydantoinase B
VYRAARNEAITIAVGGGGGFGNPFERPVEEVMADVEDGLISAARAHEVYGVEVDGDGSRVEAGIAGRRVAMAAGDSDPEFDFGPGRLAWESRFAEVANQLSVSLPELPAGLRRSAQLEVYAALEKADGGPYDRATVADVIARVFGEVGSAG